MQLVLLAQEQSGWFEFVGWWGDSASVIGCVLSLLSLALASVAFPITWKIQSKIRRATQETLQKVAFVVISESLEDLRRQLGTIREAPITSLWLRAYDCCNNARSAAIRLAANPHLTNEERDHLRADADNLTQVMTYIERHKLGPNPPPAFQPRKKVMIDAMTVRVENILGRLGTRTWEV